MTVLKKQISFGITLIVICFVGIGIFSFISIKSLGNLAQTIQRHPLKVSNAALYAAVGTVKMHRSMKDVVLATVTS